jgi:hypothetical protein
MNIRNFIYGLLCFLGLLNIYGFNSTNSTNPTNFIYADGHLYTTKGQPPGYWIVGQTKRPPPKGVHPEYAQGKPDGRLTGWGPRRGSLILGFSCKNGLKNVEGKDLFIWHFGRKTPKVYVSTEREKPKNWHLIGNISETEGEDSSIKQGFEFGELDRVFYVKIAKKSFGFGTGHFIDAVAGVECVK